MHFPQYSAVLTDNGVTDVESMGKCGREKLIELGLKAFHARELVAVASMLVGGIIA